MMQIQSLLVPFLATASLVSALPSWPSKTVIPRSPPTKLPSKINGFPPKDWECITNEKKGTKRTFPADYVKSSVEYGLELRDNGDNKAGDSDYPKWISTPSSIPGLDAKYKDAKNIDHFPLNYDAKTIFTGGKPTSQARVFYQHDVGSDEATFLGVWTHGGRTDGSFIQCQEK